MKITIDFPDGELPSVNEWWAEQRLIESQQDLSGYAPVNMEQCIRRLALRGLAAWRDRNARLDALIKRRESRKK